MPIRLQHVKTFELDRAGDCQIVGVDESGCVFVEEIYGDDDLLAQYQLCMSKGRVAAVDEGQCLAGEFVPLEVPQGVKCPCPTREFQRLDFGGARLQGLAASERVEDLTRRLTISEKHDLADFLELDIDPSRLIGTAESRILSYCRINDYQCIVCRRVRIAYRLPKLRTDSRGRMIDYDSLPLYLLHPLSEAAEELPDLATCLRWTLETDLYRPQDCLTWRGKLIVADGGDDLVPSAVHIFEMRELSLDPCEQTERTAVPDA